MAGVADQFFASCRLRHVVGYPLMLVVEGGPRELRRLTMITPSVTFSAFDSVASGVPHDGLPGPAAFARRQSAASYSSSWPMRGIRLVVLATRARAERQGSGRKPWSHRPRSGAWQPPLPGVAVWSVSALDPRLSILTRGRVRKAASNRQSWPSADRISVQFLLHAALFLSASCVKPRLNRLRRSDAPLIRRRPFLAGCL